MATCRTCGEEIEVPEGWGVGPSVRRHYWAVHPDRMERLRADRDAESQLPEPVNNRSAGRRGGRGSTPPPQP